METKIHSKRFESFSIKLIIGLGLFILFILVAGSTLIAAENAASSQAWVAASTLNLRPAPSVDTQVIDQLEYGTLVDIVTQDNRWCKIRYTEKEGWVYNSYIKSTYYAWVNPEMADLHADKSLNSEVKYQLQRNDRVLVNREDEEWAYANINGSHGWIYKSFLRRGPESRWINAGVLNVRNKPSVSSGILTKTRKGEEVYILQEMGEWTEVRIDGIDGWVMTKYLSKAPINKSSEFSREEYKSEYLNAHGTLPATIRQAIEHGEYKFGMSKEQILVSLGQPVKRVRKDERIEQWMYVGNQWVTYLNFQNEYLASWGRDHR